MHEAVVDYVRERVAARWGLDRVLEFGSRDINGSIRDQFDARIYVGVDAVEGPCVDVVGDAATIDLTESAFDVVVCTEVLEHVDDLTAAAICANAHRHLEPDGVFIATMAGIGRHQHSAIDGGTLKPGEFYRNVDAETLAGWLTAAGFGRFEIDIDGVDIRCIARKEIT